MRKSFLQGSSPLVREKFQDISRYFPRTVELLQGLVLRELLRYMFPLNTETPTFLDQFLHLTHSGVS